MNFAEQLASCRVLPVLTPRDVETTVRTAEALLAGGMPGVEITLRTAAALDSLRAVKQRLPELLVAAGTVINAQQVAAACDAGADFCVSPGISPTLVAACRERAVPCLPGVATASEVMLGLDHGVALFKLFPAVAAGGVALLQALAGPFPQVRFCPTGGLTPDNVREFLALPNVVCCGGSWMVADALVDNADWQQIAALARAARAPG